VFEEVKAVVEESKEKVVIPALDFSPKPASPKKVE